MASVWADKWLLVRVVFAPPPSPQALFQMDIAKHGDVFSKAKQTENTLTRPLFQ